MTHATISALHVYAVKSCRGVARERERIESTGFANDRRWMVVDESGRFLTQRELPRLALIVPAVTQDGLHLSAPQMPSLHVPGNATHAHVEVKIWQEICAAFDEGAQAAQWLSEFLGQSTRLVRFDPSRPRPSNPQWTADTPAFNQFSDGYPFLVASEASLQDLNTRLPAPLPMNRFRPNIVLSGLQPYDEDRIHELVGDKVRLRLVKPCTRCQITTTDQATGEVKGPEPLFTLKTYRLDRALKGITFCQNAIPVAGIGHDLHVGQRLTIVWKPGLVS